MIKSILKAAYKAVATAWKGAFVLFLPNYSNFFSFLQKYELKRIGNNVLFLLLGFCYWMIGRFKIVGSDID